MRHLKSILVSSFLAIAVSGAHAQNTPIFKASFPASWNGTSTTVVNQSGLASGFQSGTASFTTAVVPAGSPVGTGSMGLTGIGGIKVTPNGLLNNAIIAAAGGFTFDIQFLWDGTDSTSFSHIQKLVDYAGTESLQLITTAGSAQLQMTFANDTGTESTPVFTTILPNTWYDAKLTFDNTSLAAGDVTGTASLYLNGSLMASASATKGTYGDGLNRPIGIGEFGYGHTTSIIGLHGDIYSANLFYNGPVPEPSTLALSALGGLGLILFRRRKV
jgi:hypothetical protein